MPHTENLVSGINLTFTMQKSATAHCCRSVVSGIYSAFRGLLVIRRCSQTVPDNQREETLWTLFCGQGYSEVRLIDSARRLSVSALCFLHVLPWSHHWHFRSFLATELIVHKHSSESCKDRLLYSGQSLHTKQRITQNRATMGRALKKTHLLSVLIC